MRLPEPQQQGFALPLALTTSALLLLSSLSLQTLALHARQRSSQALATTQTRDAERSVAMAFQQRAAGAHACLLALPSSEWEGSEHCSGVNPALLQSGRIADVDRALQPRLTAGVGGHGGLDGGVRKGSVDAWPQQGSVVAFDPEVGVGAGVEQQLLLKPGRVALQTTDGFVAKIDALARQLPIVGQQIALTDQQAN